jgi:hypothetical protein
MRNLAELLASDPDSDALSATDLFVLAVGPNRVTDRAHALFALSRLVRDDVLFARRVWPCWNTRIWVSGWWVS